MEIYTSKLLFITLKSEKVPLYNVIFLNYFVLYNKYNNSEILTHTDPGNGIIENLFFKLVEFEI